MTNPTDKSCQLCGFTNCECDTMGDRLATYYNDRMDDPALSAEERETERQQDAAAFAVLTNPALTQALKVRRNFDPYVYVSLEKTNKKWSLKVSLQEFVDLATVGDSVSECNGPLSIPAGKEHILDGASHFIKHCLENNQLDKKTVEYWYKLVGDWVTANPKFDRP